MSDATERLNTALEGRYAIEEESASASMAEIRIVAFDAYGTLFDTGTGSVDATRKILARNAISVPPQEFYCKWKNHNRRLACRPGKFQTESVIFERGLALTYSELGIQGDASSDVGTLLATLGQRAAFPDAVAAMRKIATLHRVVIASNSDAEPLARDVARAGLTLEHVYSSQELSAYKPTRAFYTAVLDGLGATSSEVLFVGDSQQDDVDGPGSLGIGSVWINRKQVARAENLRMPLAEYDGLARLPALVLGSAGEHA